jgi:hypothetical protein
VVVSVLLILPTSVSAKCFKFEKAGKIVTCVSGKNKKAKKLAAAICKKIKKNSCGRIKASSNNCTASKKSICFETKGQRRSKIKT